MAVLVQEAAGFRLDEIFRYTRERWGNDQAEKYINGLFHSFEEIEVKLHKSTPVPAEFGVEGFFFRYESHFVYWRRLPSGDIGIATVLHQRIHQIDRFKEAFGTISRSE